MLLAEQSLELAPEIAGQACVLQTGRAVLDGPAAALARDATVQRIYVKRDRAARTRFDSP